MAEGPVFNKQPNLLWEMNIDRSWIIWSPDSTSFLMIDYGIATVKAINLDGIILWKTSYKQSLTRCKAEYSPDSRLVLCHYNTGLFNLHNARNGKIIFTAYQNINNFDDFSVSFSPDSSRLISISANIIRMWSVPAAEWSIENHKYCTKAQRDMIYTFMCSNSYNSRIPRLPIEICEMVFDLLNYV